MGLFSFRKKSPVDKQITIAPYKDTHVNLIYNLLFCDNVNLYKQNAKESVPYPFDVLLADNSSVADLEKIADNADAGSRARILACNELLSAGYKLKKKELFGVIVEVGLGEGLDVVASFSDGTARYINHTGEVLVWEATTDEKASGITQQLFENAVNVVQKLSPWDKPRNPNPTKGNVRITFLVSGTLYFTEGPIEELFNDPMAGATLVNATELMQYLMQKSVDED